MNREQISRHVFDGLALELHETARSALLAVLPDDAAVDVQPVMGGASGAAVLRVETDNGRTLLLRIETARDVFRDPHRTYPSMQAAAAAGIAPPLHLVDADAGVAVMDFVEQQPLTGHPGGPAGVLRQLGALVARLQTTPVRPPQPAHFAEVLDGMLTMLAGSDVFVPGVMAPVQQAYERIRSAYPWERHAQVASHNDINPFNVLFDGERLWLIDWELAFNNDPLADLACVANNFIDPMSTPTAASALEAELLRAWLGNEPSPSHTSRLAVMRQLNRLFYGALMASTAVGRGVLDPDLTALTPAEFQAEIESGRLGLGSPDLLRVMGKMQWAGFLAGVESSAFDDSLREAGRA